MIQLLFSIFFSFFVWASTPTFNVPSELKSFFISLSTINSSTSVGEFLSMTKENVEKIKKFTVDEPLIFQVLRQNNLKNTDTFDSFLERKKQYPEVKTIFDQWLTEEKDIKEIFDDYFFFSSDKKLPYNSAVMIFIKTLNNPDDVFLLFSKETTYVLFLQSLSQFFCWVEVELNFTNPDDKILESIGKFEFNAYPLTEFKKIIDFYSMVIKDMNFID